MKYILTGEKRYEEDYIILPIQNKVRTNDGIGDIIGINTHENILWVLNYNFDIEDDEKIQEFIMKYFKAPIQVYNDIFADEYNNY